ncbi:unnamed protein product [Bursaphelenchus okinawaensis]|uniref:Abnormal cell migration protein 18-like fibronectin type I domain-containing protein n=1 Tax=Bursaphelenchus okinawaensis TaxID=465554 RepID=A0A811K606_9BILA|nr:unnamed protein product [Bursaphelenchus okinawaensis]CAG9092191.1 unnamed protein product [Bursaphelenchus okinawaensis]
MKLLFLFTIGVSIVFGYPSLDVNRDAIINERSVRAAIISNNRVVRYETQPMPRIGGKGKDTCLDRTGKTRKDGEEYECTMGKFKLRCNKGQEEVIACLGSDRTDDTWLKVGETLNKNGFWHKCEKFDNTSVVYHQELSCRDANRKEVHIGDELTVASLRLKCVVGGYEPIGCFIQSKSGDVSLKEGEEKTIDGFPFKCKTETLHRAKRDGTPVLGAGVATHGTGSWTRLEFPTADELGKTGSEIKADPEDGNVQGSKSQQQTVNAQPITVHKAEPKPAQAENNGKSY